MLTSAYLCKSKKKVHSQIFNQKSNTMKKLTLLLLLIFPVVFLTAQTVDRIMVVQENATGTW
jgi:hypothetical protein